MKIQNIIQTIIIILSMGILVFWESLPQYTLWDVSWYSLLFVMLIRPVSQVFSKYKILRKFVPFRKSIGVLSAMVILSSFFHTTDWASFPSAYFTSRAWDIESFRIFARLGEITAFLLVITSNNVSMRILKKWWKRIQNLSYVYFFSGGIYLFSIGKTEVVWGILLVIIFWILAKYKVKILK